MIHLNFETIHKDAESLVLAKNDSYIRTYPEFIKYFQKIDKIDEHHLNIASHFVYGWMPTIIHLDLGSLDKVLLLLNDVKSGRLLNEHELETLKKCINNSMVGTSKLLHFINPNDYAIWDSRIFRYVTKKKSSYGIDKPSTYLKYLGEIKKIKENINYDNLHSAISKNFNYTITPMRAIEIVMFEADKRQQLVKS